PGRASGSGGPGAFPQHPRAAGRRRGARSDPGGAAAPLSQPVRGSAPAPALRGALDGSGAVRRSGRRRGRQLSRPGRSMSSPRLTDYVARFTRSVLAEHATLLPWELTARAAEVVMRVLATA